MSDRAQIAALGERFDRERPRLAFDGCMRMHFERHPPNQASTSAGSAIDDIIRLSDTLESMQQEPMTLSLAVAAIPVLVDFQRALARLRGGK